MKSLVSKNGPNIIGVNIGLSHGVTLSPTKEGNQDARFPPRSAPGLMQNL